MDALLNKFDPLDSRPFLLMFQDEGRFGRISEIYNCWCPEKTRPLVPKQFIREYIYAYSAIAPKTGDSFSLILPDANTESMLLFLKEVSEFYKDYKIIMVMDKAGWHRMDISHIDNIEIMFLPPYSPELNPVEHLWEYVRENYIGNNTWDSLDDLEDHLVNIFSMIHQDKKEEIKSLANFSWL